MVLDEPTVGQDAIQKAKLAEVVNLLHSTGKTIIIVSHDVEFLWLLQPRMLVMTRGKVVGDAPCSELMLDRGLLDGRASPNPSWSGSTRASRPSRLDPSWMSRMQGAG